MNSVEEAIPGPLIFSEAAANKVKELIEDEGNDALMLRVFIGGGAYNLTLMKTIQDLLPNIKVSTTADYGLTPDCIEAVTFAWLAKQRIENKPANLPSVTGANKNVLLGGIYSPS